MPARMCTSCRTRRASSESPEGLLCVACLRYAEDENQHSDDAHDLIAAGEELMIGDDQIALIKSRMEQCDICLGVPDPATVEPPKGHTNTRAKTYTSHATCDHPRTPKAREICRRARKAANIPTQRKAKENA